MKVTLREWQESDAESLALILNNKNILNNLRDGLPYPYTYKDALEFIKLMRNSNKNSVFAFAVIYNGEVAGSIGVFRQNNIHSLTAELGYYIGETFWNKGIATYAVKKACDFVFENSDIIRIYAEPFSRNTASCKVLEKANFELEGIMRANAVKCGVVEDMKLYALIKK